MEASASFETRSSVRALIVLVFAVLAALLVGATGGYVVRALTYSVTTNVTETHQPFVIEPVPYSSPAPTTRPQPTRDPKGFEVPI